MYRRSMLVLLASVLTACASAPRPEHPADAIANSLTASRHANAVQVEVSNNNFYDVVVYALVSGVKTRIGTVAGHGKQLLRVSASLVSQGVLQFAAHPIGSTSQATLDRVSVQPGQRVSLTIMPSIEQSFATVR